MRCFSANTVAEPEESFFISTKHKSGETIDAATLPSLRSFECRQPVPAFPRGWGSTVDYDLTDVSSDSNTGLGDTTADASLQRSWSSDEHADDEASDDAIQWPLSTSENQSDDEGIDSQDSISHRPQSCRPQRPVYVVDGEVYPRTIAKLPSRNDNNSRRIPASPRGWGSMVDYDLTEASSDSEPGFAGTTVNASSQQSWSSDGYADDEASDNTTQWPLSPSEEEGDDEGIDSQCSISHRPQSCWPQHSVHVVDGEVYPRTIARLPSRSDNNMIWKLRAAFPDASLNVHPNRLVYDSRYCSKKARTRLTFKRPLSNEDYQVLMKRAKLAAAETS